MDDSYELPLCGDCLRPTVGGTLIAGLCMDCYLLQSDTYDKQMEEKWKQSLTDKGDKHE